MYMYICINTRLNAYYQPARDVSEMSQSDLHWERHPKDLLETSQKRRLFCDVFKTSQIHLKKDVFFVTSLRRLRYIWKRWLFWYASNIHLPSICDYSKISHKNGFVLIKLPQELSYLPCALPYRFIFVSETDYMTLGESKKSRCHILGHGRLAGNNPEMARAGQKSHKIYISWKDSRRNLTDPSKWQQDWI